MSTTYTDQAGVVQHIAGTTAVDEVFVIDGLSSNYGWGPTEDGQGIVVWDNSGNFDILTDIEYIQFNDQQVATSSVLGSSSSDDSMVFEDIAGSNQIIQGTSGNNDIFVIDGDASSFGWSPTSDGQGVVIWDTAGHYEIVNNVEIIRFNNIELTVEQLLGYNTAGTSTDGGTDSTDPGESTGVTTWINTVNVVDHVTGTDGEDVFSRRAGA